MSIRSSNERRRHAAEQAADWLMALQAGELSDRERDEFVDWLRESPLHVAEMLRISRVKNALSEFGKWSEIAGSESEPGNVVMLDDARLAPPEDEPGRNWVKPWAMAASLAAVALVSAWLFISQQQSIIRTQAGERRELMLADGSVLDIAPATELRVQLRDRERLVKLESGQAFFNVAKDASRPFVVDAGDTRVRAVGTAFNVARSATDVTVTVLEGRVAVIRESATQGAGAKSSEVLLSANEQVVVTPVETTATPVRTVNSAAETAWTDGKLVFNDETVAEVVRRFNVYNRTQIQILDQALGARRVSGVFEASDPESFIAFVRSTTDMTTGDTPQAQEVIRLEGTTQ